jgi:hypothetical protein
VLETPFDPFDPPSLQRQCARAGGDLIGNTTTQENGISDLNDRYDANDPDVIDISDGKGISRPSHRLMIDAKNHMLMIGAVTIQTHEPAIGDGCERTNPLIMQKVL